MFKLIFLAVFVTIVINSDTAKGKFRFLCSLDRRGVIWVRRNSSWIVPENLPNFSKNCMKNNDFGIFGKNSGNQIIYLIHWIENPKKCFKNLINSTGFRRRRNQKQDNNPTNHFVAIKKVCKSVVINMNSVDGKVRFFLLSLWVSEIFFIENKNYEK